MTIPNQLTSLKNNNFERMLLETLPVGLLVCDLEGKMVYVNEAFASMIGYSVTAALELTYWEITPKEFEAQEQKQLVSLQKTGRYGPYQKEYIHQDGHRFPVRLSGVLIQENGQDYIWSSIEDITDHKKMEDEIRYSRELFSRAFQSNPGLIALSEPSSGKHLDVNESWLKALKFTREEVIGENVHNLNIWNNLEDRDQLLKDHAKYGHVRDFETQFRTKDGTLINCLVSTESIKMDEQELVLWTANDITEIKKSEAQLREILEDSPIGIAITSRSEGNKKDVSKRLFVNKEMVRLHGASSADELIAADITDSWVDPDQKHVFEEKWKNDEDTTVFEALRRRMDGTEWWCMLNSCPIVFNGQLCTINWQSDITERKHAEERLRWLVNVFDGLTESVAIFDHEDRMVFCNQSYKNINRKIAKFTGLGVKFEDILQAAVAEGLFPDAIGQEEKWSARRLEQHRACGEPFMVLRDGAHLLINEQRHPDGGIAILAVDLSAQMHAEEQARSSRARLEGIFSIAPEAVITIGSDMNIQMFNSSAERIFGYQAKEVLGRSMNILMPEQFHIEHAKHIKKFNLSPDIYRSMDNRDDIIGLHKNGSEFPASASVSKLEIDGEKIYTVMLHDITGRRTAEIERRKALNEAEKANRSKSAFLATMSHELRTPLNAIIGFSDILVGQYFGALGSPKYKEYAEDIHASGKHLLTLVNDILDLSAVEAGEQPLKKQDFIIKDLADECAPIIIELARRKDIQYTADIPKDLPPLYADKRAIKQILLNLLSNALKFTPQGGDVRLKVANTPKYQTIKVEDTGRGIAADEITTITKPFVRGETNPHLAQEGTGLGLSIVKSFVDLHQGELIIESEIGKGTIISVKIPKIKSNQ